MRIEQKIEIIESPRGESPNTALKKFNEEGWVVVAFQISGAFTFLLLQRENAK